MISLEKHSDTAALIGRLFFHRCFFCSATANWQAMQVLSATWAHWGFQHLHYSPCLPSSLRSALAVVALRRADRRLPLLRYIILNDDKFSTYKLALLRAICRIADGAANAPKSAYTKMAPNSCFPLN